MYRKYYTPILLSGSPSKLTSIIWSGVFVNHYTQFPIRYKATLHYRIKMNLWEYSKISHIYFYKCLNSSHEINNFFIFKKFFISSSSMSPTFCTN